MMKSFLLESLYKKYDIANLKFGTIHDKLGDLYEEYCVLILENKELLQSFKNENSCDSIEYEIFKKILHVNLLTTDVAQGISAIEATTKIPHRTTHGQSKTDVIMRVYFDNGDIKEFPISCKQTTVPQMAFAEFDVDSICREVKITDERLKELMLKHQIDKSAKNFTAEEKKELRERLQPIAKNFVRWVVTGSPEQNPDGIVFPKSIVKFKLKKPADKNNIIVSNGDFELLSVVTHTVEEYVDSIMLTPQGNIRAGGFGTGLSWTYATGSGGFKIQFKA